MKLAVRKFKNRLSVVMLVLLAVAALVPLLSVFTFVLQQGLPSMNWSLVTELPKPVGEEGGGYANAVVGSLVMILMAAVIGVPLGIFSGIYLAEFSKEKLARVLRLAIDLLTSVPSIVIGLFVYGFVVRPMKTFSAGAGAVALAIIMLPIIAKTTEEMLKLMPNHIREAGLALGLPRYRVIMRIVLKGSIAGIVTGLGLAIARAVGETAPLLFTAFGNQFWSQSLNEPTASLPVQIYTYAISPFDEWHKKAWAGALLLMGFVLCLNLISKLVFSRKRVQMR